jgi:hypothetical protein
MMSDWKFPYPKFDPFYDDRIFSHMANKKRKSRKLSTGKYETREELIKWVKFFSRYQSQNQVASTCGISQTLVANIMNGTAN